MPLEPGKSGIGPNITTEEQAGKPHDQALAIALDEARKTGADVGPAPVSQHSEGAKPSAGRTTVVSGKSGSRRVMRPLKSSTPAESGQDRKTQDRPNQKESSS
jgi:hypothetical protein